MPISIAEPLIVRLLKDSGMSGYTLVPGRIVDCISNKRSTTARIANARRRALSQSKLHQRYTSVATRRAIWNRVECDGIVVLCIRLGQSGDERGGESVDNRTVEELVARIDEALAEISERDVSSKGHGRKNNSVKQVLTCYRSRAHQR